MTLPTGRLRPALGRLRKDLGARPERRAAVRELCEAVRALPPSPGLEHPERCRVARVLPAGDSATVVLLDGVGAAPVVGRVAHRGNDGAGLKRHYDALAALGANPRLEPVWPVLPRQLALGTAGGRAYAVESVLPGSGSREVPPGLTAGTLSALALSAMAQVHAASGGPAVAGEALLDLLVEEPVAALGRAHPDVLVRFAPQLDLLRSRVRDALLGQPVHVSWTHGDLWLGNVLTLDGRLTGIVDWDAARDQSLSVLDAYHFLLTTRVATTGEDLGPVVCELLSSGRWDEAEARCLAAGVEPLAASATVHPELLLLTWLSHVSATALKRLRFDSDPRWQAVNVDLVLEALVPV